MPARSSGFSLVELMAVIAILAVILIFGVPNFQNVMRYNRVTTATNALVTAVALARSESVGKLHGSRLCPSANGLACGASWNDGWMVWVDRNNNGIPDDDEVLQYFRQGSGVSVDVTGNDANMLRFDARGRPTNGVIGFTIRPTSGDAATLQRVMQLNASGQMIKVGG
ncbi:MAG: GspH/FimT family pseudopilin [Xanthomonadaceae bacterium]|jgi:type IV fimbrial biogenesis protein FimT|nr:GspH/FimT family pseudopilin [Xanthomonadaceae bacterium]